MSSYPEGALYNACIFQGVSPQTDQTIMYHRMRKQMKGDLEAAEAAREPQALHAGEGKARAEKAALLEAMGATKPRRDPEEAHKGESGLWRTLKEKLSCFS